jgi:hypothetical protein
MDRRLRATFSRAILQWLLEASAEMLIITYDWTGQRSGSGLSDIARPALGVFASLDRF